MEGEREGGPTRTWAWRTRERKKETRRRMKEGSKEGEDTGALEGVVAPEMPS